MKNLASTSSYLSQIALARIKQKRRIEIGTRRHIGCSKQEEKMYQIECSARWISDKFQVMNLSILLSVLWFSLSSSSCKLLHFHFFFCCNVVIVVVDMMRVESEGDREERTRRVKIEPHPLKCSDVFLYRASILLGMLLC